MYVLLVSDENNPRFDERLMPCRFPLWLGHLGRLSPQLGEAKSWRAGAVLLAIPPRLVLPPLISWEPSLPAGLAEAAGATPTWMADTTKVQTY